MSLQFGITNNLARKIKTSRASLTWSKNFPKTWGQLCSRHVSPLFIFIMNERYNLFENVLQHLKSSVSIRFGVNLKCNLFLPRWFTNRFNFTTTSKRVQYGNGYKNIIDDLFDMILFEVWFFKIMLPHIQEHRVGNQKAPIIGDKFVSYFSIRSYQDCSRKQH